jgi:arylsulfate sulfotransferase
VSIEYLVQQPIEVVLSPNGTTPLAAEVTLSANTEVDVSIEVLGTNPVTHEIPEYQKNHEIPILGLYPGVENEVVLKVSTLRGAFAVDTLLIVTNPLPDFLPSVEIRTANRDQMESGWTLSSLSIGVDGEFESHPIMFDANGDIRWYLDLSAHDGTIFVLKRLGNGNLLLGFLGEIYELDMLGGILNRWPIPGYNFHHDVIEKPNGNLIVAVNKKDRGTVEDQLIEIDRSSGEIVSEWDLRQVLDVSRRSYPPTTDNDWFHMNAVWYDESDGGLIISGRNQGVVKVSADNDLVWILAPHRGWGQAGVDGTGHDTSDYLLTAVNATGTPYGAAVQQGDAAAAGFDWGWGQHASMILPNGNIFIFDNGLNRNFALGGSEFSRGVEYVVDEMAMTVKQVWHYGESRGAEFRSPIISDVDYLPETGNRLIMPGIIPGASPRALVTEVSFPGKQVVFEAQIGFKNLRGSGAFEWGQFDMVYRSERMSLYPED